MFRQYKLRDFRLRLVVLVYAISILSVFVIGSAAHVPEKVGSFEGPLARALEAGLDPACIVNLERI